MAQIPFWQPAEARPQLWRTIVGFVLIMAGWMAATAGIFILAGRITGRAPGALIAAGDFRATALYFLSFLGFHAMLALILPVLHRRGYASLFGPTRRLHPRHFAIGVAVTLGLALLLAATMWIEPLFLPADILPEVSRAQALGPWFVTLLPALVLIFIQTLGEEVVFRGYLLQQLRARFRSGLIWAVLPALGFGLLHYDASTYGELNAALYVLNAALSGTFAAIVTARSGNLGAAAGLHFGNNASLVLLGIKGNFSGFSLFVVEMDPAGPYASWSILSQTAVLSLAFVLWLRVIAKAPRAH